MLEKHSSAYERASLVKLVKSELAVFMALDYLFARLFIERTTARESCFSRKARCLQMGPGMLFRSREMVDISS